MRKLASVQRIAEVKCIEGADKVDAFRVNGWWVVDKKGAYKVGDYAVYFEIDSWMPHHLAPFLTKEGKQPKEYLGIKGERLKTAKLRGQLSQGLLLPLDNNENGILDMYRDSIYTIPEEGYDLTSLLGIVKWEDTRYMNDSNAKGSFPSFIPKTDQERVQNILRSIENWKGMSFEVTVKRDGSSMTAFVNGDDEGVCSRNMLLRETDSSAFWHAARSLNLLEKIRSTGRNLAFQGELLSQKIQGNYEKVSSVEWNCFDVWDIDNRQYLLPKERQDLCESLGIPHIKIIDKEFILDHTVDQLLEMAEGPGINPGVQREGLVFKANTGHGISFKAVSNSYLLATKR